MLLFAMLLAAAQLPAEAVTSTAVAPDTSKSCPRTTSHYAWDPAKPLMPRKLTELPTATTYMAVFRHIGLCEAPMTMVEYRTQGRRH